MASPNRVRLIIPILDTLVAEGAPMRCRDIAHVIGVTPRSISNVICKYMDLGTVEVRGDGSKHFLYFIEEH